MNSNLQVFALFASYDDVVGQIRIMSFLSGHPNTDFFFVMSSVDRIVTLSALSSILERTW